MDDLEYAIEQVKELWAEIQRLREIIYKLEVAASESIASQEPLE